MADFNKIIGMNDADLETLKTTGSVTIEGTTVLLNAGDVYCSDKIKSDQIDETNCLKKFVSGITDNGDGTISITVGAQTITFTGSLS